MEDRPGRARGPLQGVSSLRALCGGPRRGKLYPGSSVGGSASGLWVPSPETPALHPRGGRLSQPSPGDGGPLARRPQVSRPPTAQPPRFTPIHSSSAAPRTGSKTNSIRNPAHVAQLRSRAGFGAGAGAPGAWLGVSGRGGHIVQAWDMETQDHSLCFSGLLCVCIHGCVLFSLYISLHAALITGCSVFLSLCPPFLYVSAILFLRQQKSLISVCVCGLCVPVTYE